jgi:hypothetical protein
MSGTAMDRKLLSPFPRRLEFTRCYTVGRAGPCVSPG